VTTMRAVVLHTGQSALRVVGALFVAVVFIITTP
jgi:hypothetical protein